MEIRRKRPGQVHFQAVPLFAHDKGDGGQVHDAGHPQRIVSGGFYRDVPEEPVVQVLFGEPEVLELLQGAVFLHGCQHGIHGLHQVGLVFSEHQGGRESLLALEGDLDPVLLPDFGIEYRFVLHQDIGLSAQEGLELVGIRVEKQQMDIVPLGQFYVIARSGGGGHPESGQTLLVVQMRQLVLV